MVCLVFIVYHLLTFICYIEVNFTFSLVDCVRYDEDFVKSRFCSIHFNVILAGLKKIDRLHQDLRYIEVREIKVLFHTFYCNFGRAEENRSLYQGLCIKVRYIEVPL